jgi:protein EFR3
VYIGQLAETDGIDKTKGSMLMRIYRNVQVTLQILAALIEKAPRDLPLYAPYVLKILNIILRSRDITMVESSIPTFEAFCEHHDGASLSADQEYLHQYEEIVRIYASFASTRPPPTKPPISAPVAMRWRSVGLQAIKSVASSEALASLAGRQLDVIVPILLENLWTDNEDFIDLLEHRAQLDEKIDTEKLLRRRTSIATVRTVETATEANAAALSGTTADADKVAEEDIGVLAIQCLKQIFVVNNRSQIHGATIATLKFIADRVAQGESVIEPTPRAGTYRGWATRIFEMTARWTPVQDRYVILVTAMDTLIRSTLAEENLQQQLVLATMVDSLLKSDINLIGLSVMDVLLGLIQHVLRVLQLGGALPHAQQNDGSGHVTDVSGNPSPAASVGAIAETATVPTNLRRELLARLQDCIGDLATHVYYADQISDMVSAILLRLKPSPLSSIPNTASAMENPNATTAALASAGDLTEDPNTDGFFSFDTAKVKALEAIKSVLLVASNRKSMTGAGSLARNRVPIRVWEGTQWLLRDPDGRVRKAYVDALLTWLDQEMTKSDLRIFEEKPKVLTKTTRDDSTTNLSKRAVSNASHREKPAKPSRTTFLQLLHLAIYENALQYVDSESDIVLLHLLLANLVENLGVNAVKNGLPMIFRLQEDILEVETPLAKIRVGSLCHGYFWTLSEKFDFDSSPIGRAIHNEIHRRRSKMFWIDRIRLPPIALGQIGTPGQATPQQALPIEEVESESLRPFDDRFQMVKLISLSYAETLAASQVSPPTSPGRVFSHPILGLSGLAGEGDLTVPDKIKEQMMSEWSKESVIAIAQEGSKTVSLNGSRSGTNATGHRNFLAVNGNMNNGGTNSGTQSPQGRHHSHTHNSRPNSTYGLVGGLGALQKLRKGSGQSPSPASESSRNSVTRVDQLKRVLSGQQNPLPGTRAGVAHSDASSESMVSYDFSASEVSFHHGLESGRPMERSASLREPNERARSKSRDRVATAGEHSRPLSSHPVLMKSDQNVPPEPEKEEEDLDAVPPVPPLPSSLVGEGTAVQDPAVPENIRKGRSVRRSEKNKGDRHQSSSWGEAAGGPVADLESLLNGIEAGGADTKGNVGRPPY